MSRRRKRLR